MSKRLYNIPEARSELGGTGKSKFYDLVNDPKVPLEIVKIDRSSKVTGDSLDATVEYFRNGGTSAKNDGEAGDDAAQE